MKSKVKLFLVPIMAAMVIAFAIAGVASLNAKPATVSAGYAYPDVIYVNKASLGFGLADENVTLYAYMWDEDKDENLVAMNGGWPGVQLKDEGDGWYSASTTYVANENTHNFPYVVFNDGGNGKQTGNITIPASGDIYYAGNRWYTTKQQGNMKAADTWYLYGNINGVENWTDSTLKCDATGVDGNVAVWYNVALKKGDELKAIHGNDIKYNEAQNKGSAADGLYHTGKDNSNLVVKYTGVYNVYLNGSYSVSIGMPDIELQQAKYLTSNDNKYMLLASTFNFSVLSAFDNDDNPEIYLGYTVSLGNDEVHKFMSGTYYSELAIRAGKEFVVLHAGDLYASESNSVYGMILDEIDCSEYKSGTYTVSVWIAFQDGEDLVNIAYANRTFELSFDAEQVEE